jgi:hypothetical protein
METPPKWRYSCDIITACNCDWGCPCNFDARPTPGYCEGGWAMKIKEGSYGEVKLDGLAFALVAAWPRAIHEGGGTAKLYVDETADGMQREALGRVVKGQAGGSPWPVFAKTFDRWLETAFVKFEWKFDGPNSRYKAGDGVLAALEPMRNPVTGVDYEAKVVLPEGLTCKELNVTSTRSFSVFAPGLKYSHQGKNAWFGTSTHSN